jgi:hypothetical protein
MISTITLISLLSIVSAQNVGVAIFSDSQCKDIIGVMASGSVGSMNVQCNTTSTCTGEGSFFITPQCNNLSGHELASNLLASVAYDELDIYVDSACKNTPLVTIALKQNTCFPNYQSASKIGSMLASGSSIQAFDSPNCQGTATSSIPIQNGACQNTQGLGMIATSVGANSKTGAGEHAMIGFMGVAAMLVAAFL